MHPFCNSPAHEPATSSTSLQKFNSCDIGRRGINCLRYRKLIVMWCASASLAGDKASREAAAVVGPQFEWRSPNEAIRQPFKADLASAVSVASEYDLCLSGDALYHLQQRGADNIYVPLIQVSCTPLFAYAEALMRQIVKLGREV